MEESWIPGEFIFLAMFLLWIIYVKWDNKRNKK